MDSDLNAQLLLQGWELTKSGYDKKTDRFIAEATSPHGEEVSAFGPSHEMAVKNLLGNVLRMNQMRIGSTKLSRWKTLFTSELQDIAQAYSKAPAYQHKAAIAFQELGKDCLHRAQAMTDHLEILVVNNPEPYPDAQAMSEDVRKRRKLQVSKAGLEHPVWSDEEAIAYRACIDVYGYCAANSNWDWEGTNMAFSYFAPLLSVEAQKALFSQAIGHKAYATYYRAFGPVKVALFPQFLDEVQDDENPHGGYAGIHPSQMIPPVEKPAIKYLAGFSKDANYRSPFAQKLAQGLLRDPNEGWSSGIAPLTDETGQPFNARQTYGDPLQAKEGRDTAALINTQWYKQNEPMMKQAIVNAFRVVLLSPLKDLRFNAVHYQDISDIDPDESDPTTYWNHLEKKRQDWNVSRFGEQSRYEHLAYFKEWKELERLFYDKKPEEGWEAAQKEANGFIFRLKSEFEEQIIKKANNPEKVDGYKVDLQANKMVQAYLKNYLKPQSLFDVEAAVHPDQQGFDMDVPAVTPDNVKYAGFIGNHLKSIAQISQHVDELLKAALEDVRQGGKGHVFRAAVLQLGIRGVGPKVASFAWLLLQPLTSELATIDTHISQFLGHNYDKDMNTRDYFKMERELRGGLDAAGYGDIPLGQGQWMAWDYKRSGPGSHQDHSAMKVLDPVPHDQINWAAHAGGPDSTKYEPPQWWADTLPARQQVADQWDQDVAPNVKQTQIPWNLNEPASVFAKTAATRTPWFTHPETQEKIVGKPGQTIAQHLTEFGFDLPTIWSFADEAVGKD